MKINDAVGMPLLCGFDGCGNARPFVQMALICSSTMLGALFSTSSALWRFYPADGFAAFLLRCDFDSADCPTFAKKLILTKRIRWIAESTESPSFNHAWFIWDRLHKGPPRLAYT